MLLRVWLRCGGLRHGRQGELVFGSVGSVGDWLCAEGFGLAGTVSFGCVR
jgi:hypothetical protein